MSLLKKTTWNKADALGTWRKTGSPATSAIGRTWQTDSVETLGKQGDQDWDKEEKRWHSHYSVSCELPGGRGGSRAEFIQVAVALQVKHFSPPPPVGAFSGLSMLNMNSSLILAPSEPVKVTHPRWSCTSPSWRRRGCCRGKCHPLRLSRTGDKKQSLTKYQQIHIREHRSRPPASLTVKQVHQQREPAGCQANAYHQFQTLCSPPKKRKKKRCFLRWSCPHLSRV